MTRALITIRAQADRDRVAAWAAKAPTGTRVEFKASKRTLPQNDRMWAMLTDIARQREHCGRHYTPDQWKVLFMHACGKEVTLIPALDGETLVPWGYSSSDLSKQEMSDLIDFMFAWGAENGVVFNDPADEGGPSQQPKGGGGGVTDASAPDGEGISPPEGPDADITLAEKDNPLRPGSGGPGVEAGALPASTNIFSSTT